MRDRNGLVLMVGHTFLYSPVVRKIVEIVQAGDIGDIRYINSRRLNLGLFQKDINVAWDLAPHDISIILHILEEFPVSVNCQGNAHVTPADRGRNQHVADLPPQAIRHDPEQLARAAKGSRDDHRRHPPNDRLRRSSDTREDPQFTMSEWNVRPITTLLLSSTTRTITVIATSRIIKQEEPLKVECQHFLDCIDNGTRPLTGGSQGLELVRILEAASASLEDSGAPVTFSHPTA